MSVDLTKCRVSKSGNIITPKARLSFPQMFTAKTPPGSDKAKFGCTLLIPPTADISLLIEAAKKCATEKWGAELPKKLKSPFLKAEDYEYEGYEQGWVVLRPTSLQKPGLVDASGNNVDEESQVYPGRWCVASLRPFAYDTNGNRGVSFGLQNVQLLDHDEPIGGRARAEDEFEPVATAEAGAAGGKASADSVFG
jgi:hypothetical protein